MCLIGFFGSVECPLCDSVILLDSYMNGLLLTILAIYCYYSSLVCFLLYCSMNFFVNEFFFLGKTFSNKFNDYRALLHDT